MRSTLIRRRLFRPRLLRAFARLAIAVFCAQAAQPLAAAVVAAHAPPVSLAVCTATGLKRVAPGGEPVPAQQETSTAGHCLLCFAGGEAMPQSDAQARAVAPVAQYRRPRAVAPAPGIDVPRPSARDPPHGLAG
ncbi:MAG: hypothetical protein M5U08_24070 [Burkholderiales bacterium]|nr:hypothetical protein [Burkholderiales bacterium]